MNVTESQLSQWIAEMDADPSHNYGETFYDVCKFAASAARQASALQARVEALRGLVMEWRGELVGEWAQVNNHPASRFAKDIDYIDRELAAALGEDRK
jgi:hypothetical protein